MFKVDKKLILLLILVLTMGILGGCEKTQKTPDGFDEDLWRDSVKVVKIIYDTYEKENNFSVEDENTIKDYIETYKDRAYNTTNEPKLINRINKVYESYTEYLISKKINSYFLEEDEKNFKDALLKLQDLYDEIQN